MSWVAPDFWAQRDALRRQCLEARRDYGGRAAASERIRERLSSMAEYKESKTVYVYVSLPTEVETRGIIAEMLKRKRMVVPYVVGREVGLFHMRGLDELEPGVHNIFEPKMSLRTGEREVNVGDIELFIIPLVGFDERGNRLGFGGGYHDRMLRKAREDSVKIGLAYECQMVDEVPVTPADIAMDYVITEKKTRKC